MGLLDPKREEEIFTKVCSYNEGPLYNEGLREDLQSAILKVMKRGSAPRSSHSRIFPITVRETDEITIYAGPCSAESEEEFFEGRGMHRRSGPFVGFRGGAFKPRTNPHSFQGLGEEGLKIMKAGGDKYGLKMLNASHGLRSH